MQKASSPKYYLLIFIILALAIVGIAGVYLINFSPLRDTISNLSYTPPSEVTTLEEKLTLTDPAKTTFRATRPALETQSSFNDHCRSHDAEISVLGCYTDGHIYIYNITEPKLSGIVESTAAHELLHAAWDRLSESDKSTVSTYLNQVYSEHHEELSKDLAIYDDADQLDELHSRIGTQIADLPDYLETYYARYFTNQDTIVAYYNNYSTPFNELKSQMESLKSDLDDLKSTIDSETSKYYSRSDTLTKAIEEFNSCAKSPGCFATTTEFNARRNELVDEQNDLGELYNHINSAVESYNQKVNEYNNSILRTEELQNAMNSNVQPTETIAP
ncbi:hypothetical protein IJ096_01805 [Candidatus Saccharibacteria bacterium]|nr:hypothetical protein [Candidatus Saccharibacteria bacterium]